MLPLALAFLLYEPTWFDRTVVSQTFVFTPLQVNIGNFAIIHVHVEESTGPDRPAGIASDWQ
jgi:hypothetical protein